jgi:hypothetical protein
LQRRRWAGFRTSAGRHLQRRRRHPSGAVQLDVQAQFVGGIGIADRFVVADGAFVVEIEQRIAGAGVWNCFSLRRNSNVGEAKPLTRG